MGEYKLTRGHIWKILSFCKKKGGRGWCETYFQNSAFLQNLSRIGYICKQPVFGNVFVLRQAKLSMLNFEFFEKKMDGVGGDATNIFKILSFSSSSLPNTVCLQIYFFPPNFAETLNFANMFRVIYTDQPPDNIDIHRSTSLI